MKASETISILTAKDIIIRDGTLIHNLYPDNRPNRRNHKNRKTMKTNCGSSPDSITESKTDTIQSKKRKIYISGKITGLDYKDVEKKFNDAEKLFETSFIVINPLKLNPLLEEEWQNASETQRKYIWKECMANDLKALLYCDAIYMLKDWQESKGARIEYSVAENLELQIIFE